MIELGFDGEKDGKLLFTAKEKHEILCSLYANLNTDSINIIELNGEEMLFDPIIRTAMNWASGKGVSSCFFSLDDDFMNKLYSLGIVEMNNNSVPDIEYFFKTKKKCRKG